jgi:hypothetical protein
MRKQCSQTLSHSLDLSRSMYSGHIYSIFRSRLELMLIFVHKNLISPSQSQTPAKKPTLPPLSILCTMAALNLVMKDFSDDPRKSKDLDQQAFAILRDFPQPDSRTSLNSASTSILALLPDQDPYGMPVWRLGELCIELAEQIPYSHPSQLKLVWLLQQIGPSPKLMTNVSSMRHRLN